MRLVSLLALAVLAPAAAADPPKVQPRIDTKVGQTSTFAVVSDKVGPFGYATAFDPAACTVVRLYSDDPDVGQFLVIPQQPGEFRVVFWTKGETKSTQLAVFVTGPAPQPPPPDPKPPGPDPKPPTPVVPIAGDGLRVLFVVEHDDLTKYPPGQMSVMYGERCRAYLNAKCVRVGSQPQWFVVDQHAKVAEPWASALARPRASLPWVLVSTGRDGFEGPVPATEDAALAAFQRYGGPLAIAPPRQPQPAYYAAPV